MLPLAGRRGRAAKTVHSLARQDTPILHAYLEEGMSRLEELEMAIESLPEKEYSEFRRWFLERDWAKWDRQIEADSASGRLDFLVREAQEGKAKGTLKDL